MFRRLSVIPYGRMQFVDVTAGPFERAFGLASVRMHTAAAASDTRVPGLPRADAELLRDPGAAGAFIGSGATTLLAALGALWQRFNGEYRLVVADAPDGLRVRAGLVETSAETIPRGRVQALRLVQPVSWRPFGWHGPPAAGSLLMARRGARGPVRPWVLRRGGRRGRAPGTTPASRWG